MSRIKFVGPSALIIAIEAENGPPDMQLLKTKTTTNNQGMGSGKVGWGAVTSPINECIEENVSSYTQIRPEILKYLEKNNKKKNYQHYHEQCLGLDTTEIQN